MYEAICYCNDYHQIYHISFPGYTVRSTFCSWKLTVDSYSTDQSETLILCFQKKEKNDGFFSNSLVLQYLK